MRPLHGAVLHLPPLGVRAHPGLPPRHPEGAEAGQLALLRARRCGPRGPAQQRLLVHHAVHAAGRVAGRGVAHAVAAEGPRQAEPPQRSGRGGRGGRRRVDGRGHRQRPGLRRRRQPPASAARLAAVRPPARTTRRGRTNRPSPSASPAPPSSTRGSPSPTCTPRLPAVGPSLPSTQWRRPSRPLPLRCAQTPAGASPLPPRPRCRRSGPCALTCSTCSSAPSRRTRPAACRAPPCGASPSSSSRRRSSAAPSARPKSGRRRGQEGQGRQRGRHLPMPLPPSSRAADHRRVRASRTRPRRLLRSLAGSMEALMGARWSKGTAAAREPGGEAQGGGEGTGRGGGQRQRRRGRRGQARSSHRHRRTCPPSRS